MVFEQVENLCLIRGDAAEVVKKHLQRESVPLGPPKTW